jgi:hypothetical protein
VAISTDIRDRLIALERTITVGDKTLKAATFVPLGIEPFDTPVFVNYPRGATRVLTADTFYTITRVWDLACYIAPAPTLVNIGQTEDFILDLIDAVYAFFLPRPRLELAGAALNFVEQSIISGDAGVSNRNYTLNDASEVSYYIVTFKLPVSYQSHCLG